MGIVMGVSQMTNLSISDAAAFDKGWELTAFLLMAWVSEQQGFYATLKDVEGHPMEAALGN